MGHKHQIDEIRKNIPDARVVAIMSGNVTQRGEFAIFDKYTRAKSAVLCGVNAVYLCLMNYAHEDCWNHYRLE